MQQIPCDPTLTYYEMRVSLGDDKRYFWLQFRWNGRAGQWFMNVLDANRTPIRMSLAIVVGTPIMQRCVSVAKPDGLFLAIDTSGASKDPGMADLGARVQLYFYTSAELVALAQAQAAT